MINETNCLKNSKRAFYEKKKWFSIFLKTNFSLQTHANELTTSEAKVSREFSLPSQK